jgi:4-hydroxybenzoate polyprenyltransferase
MEYRNILFLLGLEVKLKQILIKIILSKELNNRIQNTSMDRFKQKISAYMQLMRLHERTGFWLLLWPCWWSITLASSNGPLFSPTHIINLAVFMAGALIMRSAGCVINDIWDRNIDPHVERTRNRPLARGAVSVLEALILLSFLMFAGLCLLLTLNLFTVLLGVVFAILVVVYPLMKRVIAIPQLFLAITINAGALMGWSAITNTLSLPASTLYIACFFWTLGYDTVYAHQDKDDDIHIGVNSAALVLGQNTKYHISAYYSAMIIFLLATGFLHAQPWPYYASLILVSAHLGWQMKSVDLNNHPDCMKKFRANGALGWILWIGMICGYFVN